MKKITILILLFSLTGCATQTFLINSSENMTHSVLDLQKPSHFFISGLGQQDVIDASKVCGSVDKVGKVETKITFLNGLLNVFTLGIYTPYDYLIYCKK